MLRDLAVAGCLEEPELSGWGRAFTLKGGDFFAKCDVIRKLIAHFDIIDKEEVKVVIAFAKMTASIGTRHQRRHSPVYLEHTVVFTIEHNSACIASGTLGSFQYYYRDGWARGLEDTYFRKVLLLLSVWKLGDDVGKSRRGGWLKPSNGDYFLVISHD